MNNKHQDIVLVGHPYAPIGRGEDVRCTYRALRSVGMRAALVDIYGMLEPEADARYEFSASLRQKLGDINVFHINGDEVEQALSHLQGRSREGSYNIVYPAWELSRYPEDWARRLDSFDEIWAPSRFIEKSLYEACNKPVVLMPLATEVVLSRFLGRRYFDISESDYIFLFFFDVRSYPTRKNPEAVIEAFRLLIKKRPLAQARLVIKISGGEHNPAALERLQSKISDIRDRVKLITRPMDDNQVKNLIRCTDCFISLHRSEGYGRGIAEAMCLGKPVIATNYSGNVDFTLPDAALLVRYELVPVAEHAYPYYKNQVWADPDVEHASDYMRQLIDNPAFGRRIAERASRYIRVNFGYRASGLRFRQRLSEIIAERRLGISSSCKVSDDQEPVRTGIARH